MTFRRLYRLYPCLRCVVVGILAISVVWVLAPLSEKAHAASGWQKLTQADLTIAWWQWLYTIPARESPVIDETGTNAFSGQPYSDLLFLAGTYIVTGLPNGDVQGVATRYIKVKEGTALFFPLINAEADNTCLRPKLGGNCLGGAQFPNNMGVPQLQALANAEMNPVSGLYVTLTPADQNFNLNGPPIPVTFSRLQSPHPFPYKLPATDNLYQYMGLSISGTVAPAVGDGYYSFIPLDTLTLDQGYYQLKFGGTVPINNVPNYFMEDITYYITVVL